MYLRLGIFDVLVGVNLLREGLDLPEVSLVAILDADKEGFLRSERSLIQTIGRAARNLKGKAILYADKITGSMERAIGETNRRREIQDKFNKENNITPRGVKKAIADVMETGEKFSVSNLAKERRVAEQSAKYKVKTPAQMSKAIKELEEKMFQAAKDLEFEKAAKYRDEISLLRETVFK